MLLVPTAAPEIITSSNGIDDWITDQCSVLAFYYLIQMWWIICKAWGILSLFVCLDIISPCQWKNQLKSWWLQSVLSSLFTAGMSCKPHTAGPQTTAMVTNDEHELWTSSQLKNLQLLFNLHTTYSIMANAKVPISGVRLREIKYVSPTSHCKWQAKVHGRAGSLSQPSSGSGVGKLQLKPAHHLLLYSTWDKNRFYIWKWLIKK